MDQSEVEAALAGLPLGAVRYFERVGSTNDEAEKWAEEGAPDLALVIANEQTAGRGRLGRRWYTAPGAALAFSLILRPTETLYPIPRLTALGALAACEALGAHYNLSAQIKWPNDVLLARRKVAGVLVEGKWVGGELTALILGIGINIASDSISVERLPPSALNFPVTCLENELRKPVDRLVLLRFILKKLLFWKSQLNSDVFLQAWESALAFKGEWVRVVATENAGQDSFPGGVPFEEGQIVGLTPDGSLRIRNRSGQEVLMNFGEVRLQK